MADYFLPMAERAYGDAATSERERGAATLSRWIFAERPTELILWSAVNPGVVSSRLFLWPA